MCMKNINVTTEFYEKDLSGYSGAVQMGQVIDCLTAQCKDGKYYIDELTINTLICAMSSSDDPDLTNKYAVRWTLGTIETNEGKDVFDYYIISDAEFDPMKNRKGKKPNAICRHFSNQSFKFTLRDYEITKEGDYYLKVFLKGNADDKWILQSMNFIQIKF